MSNSIETVVRERERNKQLSRKLGGNGPSTKGGSDTGGLEMPSEEGGSEVRGAEDVEAAGEDAAGDSVERGADPGYLGLVDSQVRGDGAVATLGGEEVVGF